MYYKRFIHIKANCSTNAYFRDAYKKYMQRCNFDMINHFRWNTFISLKNLVRVHMNCITFPNSVQSHFHMNNSNQTLKTKALMWKRPDLNLTLSLVF